MCLYPKLIKNKRYTANKKNGGNIPPIQDERTRYVPVGCQNCMECRNQKARAWQVRLLEDIKTNKNGKFITLTFNNESIKTIHTEIQKEAIQNRHSSPTGYEMDNATATKATRLFLERWRKEYGKSLRHWLITELGHNGTENIHIHGIIWTNEPLTKVEEIWNYGYVWKGKKMGKQIVNYVNDTTIAYITKYVTKLDQIHTQFKPKILTSPGIGRGYTAQNLKDWTKNKFNDTKTIETYRTTTGHKIALPIYWRNKIYNEQEREKLWLIKLDKEERWILGNKIDVSQTDEEYKQALKYAQQKNTRLGYGNDTKNQEQDQYERDRRMLMHKTRIIKAMRQEANTPPGG